MMGYLRVKIFKIKNIITIERYIKYLICNYTSLTHQKNQLNPLYIKKILRHKIIQRNVLRAKPP
jgi:hypothetical protein